MFTKYPLMHLLNTLSCLLMHLLSTLSCLLNTLMHLLNTLMLLLNSYPYAFANQNLVFCHQYFDTNGTRSSDLCTL